MVASAEMRFPGRRLLVATLTSTLVPKNLSCRKTSRHTLVSPAARLSASLAKTTNRPSWLMDAPDTEFGPLGVSEPRDGCRADINEVEPAVASPTNTS